MTRLDFSIIDQRPSSVIRQAWARATEARANPYVVEVHDCWNAVESAWAPVLEADLLTPLQSNAWLATWYRTVGRTPGRRPLVVEVRDRNSGERAWLLPLTLVTRGRLRAIEFADDGITDYNMPIPGPAAPVSEAQATLACAAILAALPPADLLNLDKMPERLGHLPNPLALLPRARPSILGGHRIHMSDDYEGWYRGLARKDRKAAGRSSRLFSAMPNTGFTRADAVDPRLAILKMIETEQRRRLGSLGEAYRLDEEANETFYRALVSDADPLCPAIVTALTVDDEPVAGLLSLARGSTCIMLRLAFREGPWEKAAPGRLLIERTMRALHRDGYRSFDLGIGDYRYKRQFDPERVGLIAVTRSLSLRGLPQSAGVWAKAQVRRSPVLARWARRLKRYATR